MPYCLENCISVIVQGVYKSRLTNFQETSEIFFLQNSVRFLREKPYNIEMQTKFVMSMSEHVVMSLRPTLIIAPSNALTNLWTTNPRTSPCTVYQKSPTRENYTANYKIFREHQLNCRRFPVFQGAISNSRRFPGVVDTLQQQAMAHRTTYRCLFRSVRQGSVPENRRRPRRDTKQPTTLDIMRC